MRCGIMRSDAYSAKRKIHIMRKMRRHRSNVWTAKRKSPLLCGIRYGICRVRYITQRESTHNSKFCAEIVIFRAGVHIAQHFAKTLRPSSLYAVWRSTLASHGPIYFSSCVSFNISTRQNVFRVAQQRCGFLFCERLRSLLSTQPLLLLLFALLLLFPLSWLFLLPWVLRLFLLLFPLLSLVIVSSNSTGTGSANLPKWSCSAAEAICAWE